MTLRSPTRIGFAVACVCAAIGVWMATAGLAPGSNRVAAWIVFVGISPAILGYVAYGSARRIAQSPSAIQRVALEAILSTPGAVGVVVAPAGSGFRVVAKLSSLEDALAFGRSVPPGIQDWQILVVDDLVDSWRNALGKDVVRSLQ